LPGCCQALTDRRAHFAGMQQADDGFAPKIHGLSVAWTSARLAT